MSRFVIFCLLAAVGTVGAWAQDRSQASPAQPGTAPGDARQVTIPSGTKVLLQLESPVNTRTAHIGDGIYCQTSFPVTQDNVTVIPSGAYVKGSIMRVRPPGRIKGRAELQVHFTTLIFPSGYTVELPGALEDAPGAENSTVSGREGTVKADSQKGKDAATVAKTSGAGAAVGGLATGNIKGAGIGGGIGAGVGLIEVLATRGQDVRLAKGTSLEMVLQRPVTLDLPRQ